jgi:hypothetical protein
MIAAHHLLVPDKPGTVGAPTPAWKKSLSMAGVDCCFGTAGSLGR